MQPFENFSQIPWIRIESGRCVRFTFDGTLAPHRGYNIKSIGARKSSRSSSPRSFAPPHPSPHLRASLPRRKNMPCHIYVCPAPRMYCCTVAWRGAGGGTNRSAPGRTRRGANGWTRQRDGTSRRHSGSRRVSSMADADRCLRPRLLGGIISNHFIQTFVDSLRSQHK